VVARPRRRVPDEASGGADADAESQSGWGDPRPACRYRQDPGRVGRDQLSGAHEEEQDQHRGAEAEG
jgi:hypothetical protein